jgi:hypothetical protein
MAVNIFFKDDNEVKESFAEVLWILHHLRKNSKICDAAYGGYAQKKVKKYWEAKADEYMDKIRFFNDQMDIAHDTEKINIKEK